MKHLRRQRAYGEDRSPSEHSEIRSDRAPVIVAVDGRASARDAVEWAAAEAVNHNRPLQILHAFTRPLVLDPFGVVPLGWDNADGGDAAELLVKEATSQARSIVRDLEIATRIVQGPVTPLLVRASEHAEMVVLGSRGLGAVMGLLGGSVGVHVAGHVRCPVVIVRSLGGVLSGPSAARVVVGVDGSERSDPAIGFAFRAASQRGIGLSAVHAWNSGGSDDPVPAGAGVSSYEDMRRRALHEKLAAWRDAFPAVDVKVRLSRAGASRTLVAESAGAALVVVGSRGRGSVRGMAFGSVSQTVLRHAHSPVAVVGRP
jgi:nucleotide-binding universal stress UspA family protein